MSTAAPHGMAGSGIDLDLSRWPVLVITPPARALSDAELEAFLERFEAVLAERRGPYVNVLDLRNSGGLSPKQRQLLGRRMNAAHEGVSAGRQAGTAMVFTSALMRSLLTAIFWLRKSNHPTTVFSTLGAALDWAERTVRAFDIDAR